MAREDGFLSRWSRLKQEAAKPAPPQPSAAALAAAREAEEARAAELAAREAAAAEAEAREREEVLARLPRIEDLVADSDFRPFMHPLVPQALRNAALSRLWVLDPGILGYVDPALDYAHDWNVPGGIPGGGPPPSAEEVQQTLRQVFARFDSEERVDPPAGSDPVAQASPAPAGGAGEREATAGEPGAGQAVASAQPAAEPRGKEPLEATGPGPEAGTGLPPGVPAAPARDDGQGLPPPSAAGNGEGAAAFAPSAGAPDGARVPVRRHGGAMPA